MKKEEKKATENQQTEVPKNQQWTEVTLKGFDNKEAQAINAMLGEAGIAHQVRSGFLHPHTITLRSLFHRHGK